MKVNQNSLTQKDLLKIKKMLEEEIGSLVEEMKKVHKQNEKQFKVNQHHFEENKKLLEKMNTLVLKVEKLSIKAELIHETFLDVMVLVKLHNKKIKELEKKLESQPELRHS